MLKILITGATGYIGNSFLKSIDLNQYEVYLLLRKPYSFEEKIEFKPVFYDGKMGHLHNNLIEINPDYIFHFAGFVDSSDNIDSIDNLIDSNVKLSTQIFYCLKDLDLKKIVIASTHWQNYSINNLYTKTKQIQEDMLHYFSSNYSVHGISIRIPDVFGPSDPRPKVWNSIIDSIKYKSLLMMSEGEQEIDLMYIDDVISAFKNAMKAKKTNDDYFNIYNISSQNIMTLKNIVSVFESKYASKSNIVFGAKPYRNNEIMKIKRNLKILPEWQPKFNVERAIIDFISKQKNHRTSKVNPVQ